MPAKTNLVVPKRLLSARPPHPMSRLGRRRGALRQYRDHHDAKSLHIKEYPDHWVVHVDEYNPHARPLRHIFVDHGYSKFFHLFDARRLFEKATSPPPVTA